MPKKKKKRKKERKKKRLEQLHPWKQSRDFEDIEAGKKLVLQGINPRIKGFLTRGHEMKTLDAQANHIVGSCASVAVRSQSVARQN